MSMSDVLTALPCLAKIFTAVEGDGLSDPGSLIQDLRTALERPDLPVFSKACWF